jgi:lipoate-protein ligase B
MAQAHLLDLPLTPYPEALDLQRSAVAARRQGRLDRDLIILVEHPPIFTLGRRGGRENLLVSEEDLKAKGIAVLPVERGGDITYHGPGQLVVYPLVDLNRGAVRVVAFVDALERAMVRTAAHWGVAARGDAANRGAWVQNRKLGSVGITVRRGVSFHGLALNIHTDLTPFGWINPCGIQSCRMTSLAAEAGSESDIDMAAVRQVIAGQLAQLLALEIEPVDLETIRSRL